MKCADKAKKEEKNAARRRVIPRSINKDGSLAMVHPHDWCSGFFAGSLCRYMPIRMMITGVRLPSPGRGPSKRPSGTGARTTSAL